MCLSKPNHLNVHVLVLMFLGIAKSIGCILVKHLRSCESEGGTGYKGIQVLFIHVALTEPATQIPL